MRQDPLLPGETVKRRGVEGTGVVVTVRRDPLSFNRRPLASVLWWDDMVEEDIEVGQLKRIVGVEGK